MKKYIGGITAILFAVIASAFTVKQPAINHARAASLYWYKVTYDASHMGGYIPNSSAFYVQDEKQNVNSPCPSGSVKDCLRGFTTALSSFPSSATGTDQIKKPN